MKERKWSEEELRFLKENYPYLKTEEIAKTLNRTVKAVYYKARELKLKKKYKKRPYQNKEVLTFLYWKKGLSQAEIAKKFNISQALVAHYFNKFNIPVRKEHLKWNPKLKPSKEMSWVLGVILGDGSVYKERKHAYAIKLVSKDPDFVERFNEVFCKLIGKRKSKVFYDKERKLFVIKVYSKKFYEWFKNKSVEEIVEIGLKYPKEFIKGFFDAEGGISWDSYHKRWIVHCSNNNRKILERIKDVLSKNFQIKSTIKLSWKAGTKSSGIIHRSNNYQLLITKKDSVIRFHKLIGFTIKRKRLEEVIFKTDFDIKLPEKWLKDLIKAKEAVLEAFHYQPLEIICRDTERGYHFWHKCLGKPIDPMEMNKMQLLLFDDWGRVIINAYRIKRGVKKWNKLFSKVIWRKKMSDYQKYKRLLRKMKKGKEVLLRDIVEERS